MPKPIARKPRCDQGIVVRPDRSIVITHRIVARFRRRDRAHAPAAERGRSHEATHDRACPFGQRDTGQKGMTRVRGADPTGALVAVERQHISSEFFVEELGIKRFAQFTRALFAVR